MNKDKGLQNAYNKGLEDGSKLTTDKLLIIGFFIVVAIAIISNTIIELVK